MALTDCVLINGSQIDCADSVGGVSEIYITEYENVPQGNISATSGIITAMTCSTGKKFWTFEVEKENAALTQTGTRSVENGTLFFEQSATFTLKKMSAAKRNQLYIMQKRRLMVIIKDNNGTYQLIGQTNGADALTVEGVTGKAFGDLNGYTITINGKEKEPANFVTAGLIATLTVAQP